MIQKSFIITNMPEPTSRPLKRVSNPRRILVLTPDNESHSTIPVLLERLTGVPVDVAALSHRDNEGVEAGLESQGTSTDTSPSHTFAGYVSHPPLRLDTKYYKADVPIWVDELPSSKPPASANTTETATATAAEETPIHSLDDWRTLFLGEEAREVRDVIGAIIICVQRPTEGMVSSSVPGELVPQNAHELCERRAQTLKDAVRAVADVKELIEEERGGLGEVPGLLVVLDKEEGRTGQAVGSSNDGEDRDEGSAEQPQTLLGSAWWDEELSQMGIFEFEVIGWDPEAPEIKGAKNEFGELQGMERCMQVLETHEWDAPPEDDDTEPNQDGPTRPTPQGMIRPDTFNMAGEANFDTDVDGLDFEMAGLHMSLMQEEDMDDRAGVADNDGGEEFQVERLEGLMGRVQALKDMGADLPYEERKRLAARAVEEIMKTI